MQHPPVAPRVLPILALPLLLLTGAAVDSRAQSGDAAYGAFLDTVEVEVVDVDVVVTDRDGRPVLGLEAADFELRVDGTPVEIRYFTPAGGEATELPAPAEPAELPATAAEAPADAAGAAPEPPLTLVVYLDQTAMQPGRRNEAIRGVTRFLEERVPAGAQLMLAIYDETLRLPTGITTDAPAVVAALTTAARATSQGAAAMARQRMLAQDVLRGAQSDGTPAGTARAQGDAEMLAMEIQSQSQLEADRHRRAMAGLADLISMLVGVEGRKAVLLASGGFELTPGSGLGQMWSARYGGLDVEGPADVDELGAEAAALRREYARLLRAAQTARVTLFSIDAGDRSDPLVDPAFGELPPAGTVGGPLVGDAAAATLSGLASVTGGRAFKASPELGESLGKVVDALNATYSLGFTTGPEAGDDFHRIEVKVRGNGLRVRHREGFRRRAQADRASDATLSAAAFGGEENALGVRVEVGAAKEGRNRTLLVPVDVLVPVRSLALLPAGEKQTGRVAFHFALRAADDTVQQLERRTLPLSFTNAQLPAALRQVVAMNVLVPVAAGADYRLAVGVYDEIGAARSTLVVPLAAAAKP